MARELHDNIKLKTTIAPQTVGTTGTGRTGLVVDRAGYQGVEFIFSYGTITATNAAFTPVVKEGDVTGTMTSIADANLIGLEVSAGIPQAATRTSGVNKNTVKRLGYIGTKRYVQANLSSTITAATPIAAAVLLGRPNIGPVAT